MNSSHKKGKASTGSLCPFKTLKSFTRRVGRDEQVKSAHNVPPGREVMGKTDELERQNVFIDNLLRSSKDTAIIATDLNLKVTYFNPFAEELFGYSADTVIGKRVPEIHPHVRDNGQLFKGIIAQVESLGSHTFNMDIQQNGVKKVIEATISPIKDDHGGQLSGLMLMARDVTKARRQEKLLNNTLAELQAIFDNAILGLILVRNDNIVRANAVIDEMFGHMPAELTTLKWTEFKTRTFTNKKAKCVSDKGMMVSLRKKSGELFWARVRQVAINNDAEEDVVLYLIEDVDQQKKMLEQVQQLSKAVEQSSNSIVITNTQGEIEYVNKAFVETTGYSEQEAIGQNPAILQSGQTPESFYSNMWQTITNGHVWSGEFVNKKKSGELYEEHVVVSPLRDEEGEITHFVATKENISDLKKARSQAESANQAKSDFLANMSHEIRTPMNAIIGMSELLLDTDLQEEQRRYLNNVHSSSVHLLSIINDILDYSKIEAGQLSLEPLPFQPSTLIEKVVSMLSLEARQKGLQLNSRISADVDKGSFFLGDSLRLQQILLNLVGNAVKFTDKGSVGLELSATPSPEDGLYALTFTVRDTGMGLSPEQQQEIFKRFTQSDNSITRKFGGTGLGLAISNSLVRLMGDTIHVESHPGKGSIFSFSLLLQKSKKRPEAAESEETPLFPVTKRLQILLVEDHPANQELARVLLEKLGHVITVANHGLDALHCLSKQDFDLVFMDVQMPVMDGMTATRCIRKSEQGIDGEDLQENASLSKKLASRLGGRHTYIVAVTANAMEEDRKKCLAAGMDAYLSKPYKKEFFQNVVRRLGGKVVEEQSIAQGDKEVERVTPDIILDHLVSSYGLEGDEAEMIVTTYAESMQENLVNLQQAVKNKDGMEGGRRAHALKGAFLNCGLEEHADRMALLEKELPKSIQDHHMTMVDDVIDQLQPVIDSVAA
ncbi:MAG: PAS domain S-box protein [Thermodesulfobacteriota bacterium]